MLDILRGFTLIVNDNRNLYFEIESLKLATMEENTEDFQPGGGDMALAVAGLGIKPLEVPFKVKSHSADVFGLFGGPPGVRQNFTGKALVISEKDGTESEHAIDILGRLTKTDAEEMKGGAAAGYDHVIGSITRYAHIVDGKVISRFNFFSGGWEIWNGDPINDVRRRILLS